MLFCVNLDILVVLSGWRKPVVDDGREERERETTERHDIRYWNGGTWKNQQRKSKQRIKNCFELKTLKNIEWQGLAEVRNARGTDCLDSWLPHSEAPLRLLSHALPHQSHTHRVDGAIEINWFKIDRGIKSVYIHHQPATSFALNGKKARKSAFI